MLVYGQQFKGVYLTAYVDMYWSTLRSSDDHCDSRLHGRLVESHRQDRL
jgi:hypothetical protein